MPLCYAGCRSKDITGAMASTPFKVLPAAGTSGSNLIHALELPPFIIAWPALVNYNVLGNVPGCSMDSVAGIQTVDSVLSLARYTSYKLS